LDAATVDVLRLHRVRQLQERLQWAAAWTDTGLVFTAEDGAALVPDHVSRLFARLFKEADLPPIRLHDLRHGAATLALAGGANLKVVSEMLGHSTIAITADTYTSVLPEVAREAAEAAVRLVPRATSTRRSVPILSPSGDQRPPLKGSPVTKPQVIPEGAGPVKCCPDRSSILFGWFWARRDQASGSRLGPKARPRSGLALTSAPLGVRYDSRGTRSGGRLLGGCQPVGVRSSDRAGRWCGQAVRLPVIPSPRRGGMTEFAVLVGGVNQNGRPRLFTGGS
jgi:hypothetical protein